MAKKTKSTNGRKGAAAKKPPQSATAAAMAERGLFGPTWSDAEKARLAPHVINLRAGQFVDSGDYETKPDDVRRIFDRHLPAKLEAEKAAGRKLRVLFWAHGGLVKEKNSLQYALDHIDKWLSVGIYPIFFIWETGLTTALKDIIVGRQRSDGERGFTDFTDKLLEKALHGPATAVWSEMKEYAKLAAKPGGGARFTAGELATFAKTAGDSVDYYACGHSAGSIFHAHFLPTVKAAGGPAIRDLFLLAPAVTVDLFKDKLGGQIGAGKGIDRVTMFTMDRRTEKDDNVIKIYRQSLLYFVSKACEPDVPTPILGLQDSLEDDAAMEKLFGLNGASSQGEVVWSPSSQTDTGINASLSTTHGGFDNDVPTLNSLARRITGDHSIKPFEQTREFAAGAPAATGGRRRAVCIGVDEYSIQPLSGCVNDANQWHSTLTSLGYESKLITNGDATHSGILGALGELIGSSRAGDSLVFQYAGHGTQVDDVSGDETDADGKDEALVPINFEGGNFIIDDDIGEVLDNLPDGVTLTCFMDCCNSGTNTRAFMGGRDNRPDTGEKIRFLAVPASVMRKHVANRQAAPSGSPQNPFDDKPEVLFSACLPHQTAKEFGGHGYFTTAVTSLLKNSAGKITNGEFLSAIHSRFENPPPSEQDPSLYCDPSRKDQPLLFSTSRAVVVENASAAAAQIAKATSAAGAAAAKASSLSPADTALIIKTMHDYIKLLDRLT